MTVAVARGDGRAMLAALAAMTVMIVALDQILWRPAVAWSQRFRLDEGGQAEPVGSWFLDLLRSSRTLPWISRGVRRVASAVLPPRPVRPGPPVERAATWRRVSDLLLVGLLLPLGLGAMGLARLLADVDAPQWRAILGAALLTLTRVLASTALATAWALPAGLAIGLSPRLSRVLQPVVQVVASFPAPMLFPVVVAGLSAAGVGLGWGSILLMLLGAQWYVLFNVVAGATAIPADLSEAARLYRLGRWQRFRALHLPAVFPYLVTGWITAAGGAWNASIVAEYVTSPGGVLTTDGLGARISVAAASGRFGDLAAAVTVMAVLVVAFNRFVWHRLHRLAEERFALER
jgi:NitT/TauT family transport system permease protein